MKRDSTCNVSIATEHPQMTEEANLKCTYRPGRNGGTFGLPLGAKLIVAESTCSKKDWVTCQVASPAQRWRHNPSFPEEHVTSEIFTLTGTILKQRSAILVLPYSPPQGRYLQLKVKAMWAGHNTWQDVTFEQKTDTALPCVEVEVDKMGTFLLTFRPKTEPVHVTPQGGLFHPHLNRFISLRFPKRAVDCNVRYDLKVLPVPEDCLAFCKDHFPHACRDLIRLSEFIDLQPSPHHCNFRRSATIKLPLPEGVEVSDEDSSRQVVVLNKVGEAWEWVDTKYKFTRTSVTVELKNPAKMCVVQSRPDRQRKMQEAVSVIENRLGKAQGDLTLFLSLKDKSWSAVVECCPLTASPSIIQTRRDQGFAVVLKTPLPQTPPPPDKTAVLNRRSRSNGGMRSPELQGVEMSDGLTWILQVDGDVQGAPATELSSQAGLQWFKHLPHSYRQISLEPVTREEEKTLHGTVTLRPAGLDLHADLRDQLTFVFHLEVPEKAVKNYLFVPVPAQPVPPVPPPSVTTAVPSSAPVVRRTPAHAPKKPVFTFTQTPMERLTQLPRRYSQALDREPKVLNGKSLMTLSRLINQAVPLAMELGLRESTVSGIGFDTMSNTGHVGDMTYKILLYWKRTCREKGDGAVGELVNALRQLGKNSLADIVLDRHRRNLELTTDCFLQALVSGRNLCA